MITLATYAQAREALRRRELRQALYDEGRRLMAGVIVNLHGDEHVARRRLENRLFRRDTFAWYEHDRVPALIDAVLGPAVATGCGDLLPLARRTMLALSVGIAGVDADLEADGEVDDFYGLMDRLARASTVGQATGDRATIVADGDEALAEFEARWFRHSLARRRALLDSFDQGALEEEDLPRDVLTTLLRNQDRLELPPDIVLREVAYFPWVGSHSTANQLVHAMHHMLQWCAARADDRGRLISDDVLRQRFVHESMRLHPASPVALRHCTADIELRDGTPLPNGELVVISIEAANRDPSAVGEAPEDFDPYRRLADGVPPWGLSFGHGPHTCLGQELAGGLAPDEEVEHHLLGTVAIMAGAMLRAGAERDADDPPELDPTTSRTVWGRYPVRFVAASQ